MAEQKIVKFKTSQSWAGDRFSYVPGDICDLPEEIAKARQDADLGTIVKDK